MPRAQQSYCTRFSTGSGLLCEQTSNLQDFISAVTSIGELCFDLAHLPVRISMNNGHTHVLLIEDNPGDADLVRLRLVESDSTVDVSCVNRLADGLASIAKDRPSIVLLDLNLPDSQG